MKRYINYFKYVIKHKWFVLVACKRLSVPLYIGLLHDMSKFNPSEFFAYAKTFYKSDGGGQYVENDAFNMAWNEHQKKNKHHWQYWVLTMDRGTSEPLEMPGRYVLEMVADWFGAGRVITGEWGAKGWFENNGHLMNLHPKTRNLVKEILRRESSVKYG